MAARGNKRPDSAITLRDVARLAGVHPGTASRTLNEETRWLVNAKTAERVLWAAEQLGYRPNPLARGLKTNRSFTIGVLVPDLTNPLFPPIVRGIEEGLDAGGYTPLVANTDNDVERERSAMTAMRTRQVDGFISATARLGSEPLEELVASEVPLVLVNRSAPDDSLPAVTVDDRLGMRLAVEHLAQLGHRRIAHIAGAQQLSTGRNRYEGYLEAVDALSLERDDRLVLFSENFTEAEGARLCRQLLDSDAPFTGIVAGNDLMALGCYDVFAERDLRCPEDVSVVGFNDMPFVDRFSPPLTTIRVPHYRLGTGAAAMMLERLRDPAAPPRQELLEPELVVRGSTAPPA